MSQDKIGLQDQSSNTSAPPTNVDDALKSDLRSVLPPRPEPFVTVIEAQKGWAVIDLNELWQYRDLFFFLVWRDIKVRYAQSVLGVGWAVIQPVFSMIVFTIIFGNLVQVESDGVPYAVFNYVAMVPWVYFSSSLTDATGSLVRSANMLTKVYFPRMVIPLAPVLGKLVDFGIALALVVLMMLYFRIVPTLWVAMVPVFAVLMIMAASGVGMWLTALAVQYRDINFAMSFVVQLLMYASPVVYSINEIPERFQLLYALNPMVGVIEGFRSALLNTNPMPWDLLAVSTASALVFFVTGALYFRRMERIFADVV